MPDPLEIYLAEIAKYPLLTRKQERDYATQMLEIRTRAVNLLHQDQEADAHAVLAEHDKIRNVLVKHNLRLVVAAAKKYGRNRYLPENISAGNVGILQAADTFDITKNIKFSTYATIWIKQAMLRHRQDGQLIAIPPHHHVAFARMRRLIAESHSELTDEHLSKILNLSLDMVQGMRRSQSMAGITKEIMLIPYTPAPVHDERRTSLQTAVSAAIRQLKPKLADILRFYYGLVGGECFTLEQIGHMYGVTRERIRQQRDQAEGQLQDILRLSGEKYVLLRS